MKRFSDELGLLETKIYAKDGSVVYRMMPWIAEQLAQLLPADDTGWLEDSMALLEAAVDARGNTPREGQIHYRSLRGKYCRVCDEDWPCYTAEQQGGFT